MGFSAVVYKLERKLRIDSAGGQHYEVVYAVDTDCCECGTGSFEFSTLWGVAPDSHKSCVASSGYKWHIAKKILLSWSASGIHGVRAFAILAVSYIPGSRNSTVCNYGAVYGAVLPVV
jgi:hypothetical protein